MAHSIFSQGTPAVSIGEKLANGLKSLLAFRYQQTKQRTEQRLDRITVNRLQRLDPRTLKDIGLDRGDLHWAGKLPKTCNAVTELQKIRTKQRK